MTYKYFCIIIIFLYYNEAEEGAAESNDLHERGRFAEQELLSHQKSVSEDMRAADFTLVLN
jgi:hypothetical protein